jgi:hypothetical protein
MKTTVFCVWRVFAVATAAVLAACAVAPVGIPLQSNASAVAPTVSVGDTWTYRVRDGYTGLPRPTQRQHVIEVSGDRIRIAVSQEGAAQDEVWIYDRGWNWLTHPATNLQAFNYSPPYPALPFPLAPGKTWHARLTATDPADGRRFPVVMDGTVLGWERLKVPAGEFDTVKVQRIVYIEYWVATVRGRSEIIEYEWYAPAAKQSVRREASSRYLSYLYADKDGNGGPRFVLDDWLIAELESYSVR